MKQWMAGLFVTAGIALSACAAPTTSPAPTAPPAAVPTPLATSVPTAAATLAAAPTTTAAAAPTSAPATAQAPSAPAVKLTIDGSTSQASYHAREQLLGRNLPSDAIGTSTNVTGNIVLGPSGEPVAEQ